MLFAFRTRGRTLWFVTLENMHNTFHRWLGADYDTDAIDAVVAAAAAIRLDGDPVWVLLVGGPGNAKTETVSALATTGAHAVSTIASEGALLSGTSKGERADDATGGLLRDVGDVGVVVLKDVTSILSLPASTKAGVLAALREIYDGRWTRVIGADGGRTLEWTGRICVVGAVTTAWDQAHSVVSAMGDRFVLLRMDSTKNRLAGGRQAIANTGSEAAMRADLSSAVAAVLAQQVSTTPELTDFRTRFARADRNATGDGKRTDGEAEHYGVGEILLAAANLVTLGRTAVIRDNNQNVVDRHEPEMPTRFAKQLAQIVRGGVSIGMSEFRAVGLAIRCARDSMPPIRLAILTDLAAHPDSRPAQVEARLQKPKRTILRELEALHMLGMVVLNGADYRLANGIEPAALSVPEIYVPPHPQEGGSTYIPGTDVQGSTYIPGTTWTRCPANRDDGTPCVNDAEPGQIRCSTHRNGPATLFGDRPSATIISEANHD